MNRRVRIGLIAEGEAEQGKSIPYIKPQDGGKVIDRNNEGALHTLIRRELANIGFSDCDFVQRHPLATEVKRRVGHSILDKKYLSQIVSVWKPEEVDLIVIVVDADDVLEERQQKLSKALATIRDNHLDANEQPISDRSTAGLAIRNFEAWLLADIQTVSTILGVEIAQISNLEDINNTKDILEQAITKSNYLAEENNNQRPLQIRWKLAFDIDLDIIKTVCPNGYATFINNLVMAVKAVDGVV
ncbi:MAG TPA: DUF4276 family protein [Nostocaceae cyanobacterium]|nr:DUF4276 family protein [Nostocaceae cyanobacterium]